MVGSAILPLNVVALLRLGNDGILQSKKIGSMLVRVFVAFREANNPPPPGLRRLRLIFGGVASGGFHWRGGLVNQLQNTLAYSGQPNNFVSGNEQRSALTIAESYVLEGLHPVSQDGSNLNLDGQN